MAERIIDQLAGKAPPQAVFGFPSSPPREVIKYSFRYDPKETFDERPGLPAWVVKSVHYRHVIIQDEEHRRQVTGIHETTRECADRTFSMQGFSHESSTEIPVLTFTPSSQGSNLVGGLHLYISIDGVGQALFTAKAMSTLEATRKAILRQVEQNPDLLTLDLELAASEATSARPKSGTTQVDIWAPPEDDPSIYKGFFIDDARIPVIIGSDGSAVRLELDSGTNRQSGHSVAMTLSQLIS